MPRFEERRWQADLGAFGGRSSRKSFVYRAYVPDLIADAERVLGVEIGGAISEAERAVLELGSNVPALGNLEAVARRLLRAESVASSRIEGLVMSQRRLAKAELAGAEALDETALSIFGNVKAMEAAVALGETRRPLTPESLCDLHRLLLERGPHAHLAGRIRTEQNWIGGGALSPRDAEFIPPPPELVYDLLDDLCRFVERTDVSPVFQAAVAHAQFETIHPFADGNGRVGRALIHAVLRRRLSIRFVPPISLVLAGNAKAYIRGLTAFRAGQVDEWVGVFAAAVRSAAMKAVELAAGIHALQEAWLEAAGRPRKDSAVVALLSRLPAHPLVTVRAVQELTGRSKQAANTAVADLERVGVLKQITIGKRNRAWEAQGLFDLVDSFEQEVADSASAGRPAPAARRGQAMDGRRKPKAP